MDQSATSHPPFPLASAHQLLTLLATDDAFRDCFVASPKQALLRVGLLEWQADAALAGHSCLAVRTWRRSRPSPPVRTVCWRT